jgi:hypothetical protein
MPRTPAASKQESDAGGAHRSCYVKCNSCLGRTMLQLPCSYCTYNSYHYNQYTTITTTKALQNYVASQRSPNTHMASQDRPASVSAKKTRPASCFSVADASNYCYYYCSTTTTPATAATARWLPHLKHGPQTQARVVHSSYTASSLLHGLLGSICTSADLEMYRVLEAASTLQDTPLSVSYVITFHDVPWQKCHRPQNAITTTMWNVKHITLCFVLHINAHV